MSYIFAVCHSVCIFWTQYSMIRPHSNFTITNSAILWLSSFSSDCTVSSDIYWHLSSYVLAKLELVVCIDNHSPKWTHFQI